jgi:hypothetical protein
MANMHASESSYGRACVRGHGGAHADGYASRHAGGHGQVGALKSPRASDDPSADTEAGHWFIPSPPTASRRTCSV